MFFRFNSNYIEPLTTVELTALVNPVVGKIYFDTTLGYNVFYNGSIWKEL